MEALTELCDLIAQNPTLFSEKVSWICSRCPSPESLSSGSPRVSRSQLNALLATARLLSNAPHSPDHRPHTALLHFLRSIPYSFNTSFWPQSFGTDAISSFYAHLFRYVVKATDSSSQFASEVAGFMGDTVVFALSEAATDNLGISRVFLSALSESFPPILTSDGDRLVRILLDQVTVAIPSSPTEAAQSATSSYLGSPASVSYFPHQDSASPANEVSHLSASPVGSRLVGDDATSNNSSQVSEMNGGSSIVGASYDGGFSNDSSAIRQHIASFEEESVESLEAQEIAYRFMGNIVDKVPIDPKLLEQVRLVAKRQLRFLWAFLKVRKREWSEQGTSLKVRVSKKLSTYLAVAILMTKCLPSLEAEGKSAKSLLFATLYLFIGSAEACLLSTWRKLRICEDLFSCLLHGVTQIATIREGQMLRVLLIHFKPLVLKACAQADTWSRSKGAMFDSILKACCEIIEFGWIKDRPPIDTFILGLTTNIRERTDYDEKDVKEKSAVPVVQLNVIRLLADINISVKKPELVDIILQLFTESLEEGDASSPGLLRIRLLEAVSSMARLGFEKSFREIVVLLTRSYQAKVSNVESSDSKTVPAEANTERVETIPAGFLLIARDLSGDLRSKYRERLLSLCSDVGYAAEAKRGRSGADFLGPLLPAVAEICSDFDPTVNVNHSLLKSFRNLWFYVAPFGLAPPIQESALSAASGGRVDTGALNTISGVKATYLLAVAFLEIIRFSSNGGILNGGVELTACRSAFSCVFEYLKTSNLAPAVLQCLTAIVHQAFETVVSWLDERTSETGDAAEIRDSTLSVHACFLIKAMSQREEHIRDISVKLLVQLRDKFPQILSSSSCIDAWIQIACPRLSVDWGESYGKPLLNSFEAEIALGLIPGWCEKKSASDMCGNGECCACDDGANRDAVDDGIDYPMDYYAQDGGEWNSCYSKRQVRPAGGSFQTRVGNGAIN